MSPDDFIMTIGTGSKLLRNCLKAPTGEKTLMRVPDEVRQCTVFLGRKTAQEGSTVSLKLSGSAFFVSVPSADPDAKHTFVYLVTARHVVEGTEGQEIMLRANTKEGTSIALSTSKSSWSYHPTQESVDVAVLPWAPPDSVEYKHVPQSMFLTDEIIAERTIGTGDEVFLAGLFAHLSGNKRNLPIVRLGNVAMMPDEPIPTSIGPIDGYLIEARSIGGVSGSPVFVRETAGTRGGSFYLMGLIHGHWDIPPENKNDAVDAAGANSGVNMGIAIVVPTNKILEVIDHYELVEKRKETDELRRREREVETA